MVHQESSKIFDCHMNRLNSPEDSNGLYSSKLLDYKDNKHQLEGNFDHPASI
jgi:hypothetical protein